MANALDWLEKRSQLSPDNIALIDMVRRNGQEITYRQFNAQVNQTAYFLRERVGLQKGDIVAILSSNCVEYLDVVFACNKLGLILQNLNWRLAIPELEHLINEAKPKALVYGDDFVESAEKMRKRDVIDVKTWVAIGNKAVKTDLDFLERDGFRTNKPDTPMIGTKHPWLLCYTGGTTGLPKAAIQTHANIISNAVNTMVSWELTSKDCAILNAPLFHSGGMHVFTTPLVYAGGCSVVCKAFDVEQTFDLVDAKRVTLFFGVPTMFGMMQENPRWEKTAFDHLKVVISGGAPCPGVVFNRFHEKGVNFKTGYGLTEAGPNTFWLPESMVRTKAGSVGYPLMHVETKIVDPHGLEIVKPNVYGELWIRGPHRTPGYLNNPQATEDMINAEGWLQTGDLACFDEDNCYYIVGRKKEMFISGGENVFPIEVESVLHTHPAVREAAVFSVPNAKWGEVGRAVVSLRQGKEATEQEIRTWLKEKIAAYKVPTRVFFTDELPKTAAGKVNKSLLREEFGTLEPEKEQK
jgi:fatty-acyl-CoA synthase